MILKNVAVIRQNLRRLSTTALHKNKEVFERDQKEHINLGTIGSPGHGKTTLVSKITKVLHGTHGVPVKEVSDIDNTTGERAAGQSQNASHIEFWTDNHRYSLTDLPGSSAYSRNMYTHLSLLDVCLLVINPEEGVLKDTIEMYRISKHFGNFTIPVIFTRGQTDSETVDLVQMELEELGIENSSIILETSPEGNLNQSTMKLLHEIEAKINRSTKFQEESSVYFPLEQTGSIPSRGMFCAGRIESGVIKTGTPLEVFFNGKKSKGTVKDMEIFRKKTDLLKAGDRGGVFIKFKTDIDIKRGAVLFEPGKGREVSDSWLVSLQTLKGQGNHTTKGEYMLHHSTFSDGKTILEPCNLSEDGLTETVLRSSSQFMGRPTDPILIRSNRTIIIGHLVRSIAS